MTNNNVTLSLIQQPLSKVSVLTANKTVRQPSFSPKYHSSDKLSLHLSIVIIADLETMESNSLENSLITALKFSLESSQKKISIEKSSSQSTLKFTLKNSTCKFLSMEKLK